MSHTVLVWEQPADVALPTTPEAIRRQLADWADRTRDGPSGRFLELARLMNERYAETADDPEDPPFDGQPLDGHTDRVVWPIALGTGEGHEEVYSLLASYAMALGLNMADTAGDRFYLGDGRILSPDPAAQCTPALALYHRGDDAGAWQAFLALGATGNPAALHQLAAMAQHGLAGPRQDALALALLMLGGQRQEAQQLAASLAPAQVEKAGHLLDRLRAQPAQFKAIVDGAAKAAAPAPAVPPSRSPAVAAAPAPEARPPAPRRVERTAPSEEPPVPSAGLDAVLALAVGVVGVPVALLSAFWLSAWMVWLLVAGSLGAGAWGAWHAGRARGWDASQVTFYAVVAAIPLLGSLACVRLLMRRS